LHKEKSGAIVPPLPDKQAVSRFTAAFVEERRIKLQVFLRRVAVHPELYDAPSLDTFLRADDVTFHAAKNIKGGNSETMMMSIAYPSSHPTLNVPAPPKKDGLKKWFAETKTSISGDLVRSPDDDLFVEIEHYIERLEKQMKNVSQQASNLVKKGTEISHGLFEFGLAFNALGQSEADDLGQALVKMGSTADELSSLTMEEAEKELIEFDEPLKDYLRTIHAVKLALQRRHDRRLTYTTCLSEVNVKRSNLAKFRATPGSEAKAYGAEMSLKRGESAADVARDEFATVSQRVLREVDRFKREKGDEMKLVVLEYVTAQIEYNKKMEQLWANLLPQLDSLLVSNNSGSHNDSTNAPRPESQNVAPNDPLAAEGEVEDMTQPVYFQPNHNSHIYQAGLAVEGNIQYRDTNSYPAYSNVQNA
jgi:sorting nexin-1/2